MVIVHISDTHNLHRELPELPAGDVLVHTGDCTMAGTENEAYDFMDWLCDQPHRHKIFIAGNHDFCLYGATGIEGLPDDVHYLSNTGITIDGLRFYGVPMFMEDVATGEYNNLLMRIPHGTDVLLTHQPPVEEFILGSKILDIKPLATLFGHNHDDYRLWLLDGVIYSNAAIVNNEYRIVNKPQIINV